MNISNLAADELKNALSELTEYFLAVSFFLNRSCYRRRRKPNNPVSEKPSSNPEGSGT